MSDAYYVIDYHGSLDSLYEKLNGVGEMLASDSPWSHRALRALGASVLGSFADEFAVKSAGGTDRFGETWARLAPSTIAKKGHDAILIDSMDLYNSLAAGRQARDFEGAFDTILETAPGMVSVGTRVDYAIFHQLGFMGGWHHDQWIPPRRPLPPAETLTEDWWEERLDEVLPEFTEAVVGFIGTGE